MITKANFAKFISRKTGRLTLVIFIGIIAALHQFVLIKIINFDVLITPNLGTFFKIIVGNLMTLIAIVVLIFIGIIIKAIIKWIIYGE
jgi:uncharacterized membrane protein